MELLEKEFNLLDEPWIRVLLPGYEVREVSLTDTLLHSHDYLGLAGELPTQDVAILRLLLAVLHTVYYRVDETGAERPICTAEDAYERWSHLWKEGGFREAPIRNYLEQWYDRFWLFHPERPFWQSPSASIGTPYSAAKLNGELSESNNKTRLTPSRTGNLKRTLTYSEAARWLLHLNAFDDASGKAKGKGLPSGGVGWLGKLGAIAAKGDNLFETLMLNLVLLREDNSPWDRPVPVWELPSARNEERVKIALPNDQGSLLTLQSRRLLLSRSDGVVTGYTLLGGDFFDKEGAFTEQMTIWKPIRETGKDRKVIGYQPKRHDSSRQLWRDFSSLVGQEKNQLSPGLVTWHTKLQLKGCLLRGHLIRYHITSVQYDGKNSAVTDVFSDSLSFHAYLLSELGRTWRKLVTDEIEHCDKIARCIGDLAVELNCAAGGNGKGAKESAREQFYYRVDIPFRKWLLDLNPDTANAELGSSIEEQRENWVKTSHQVALALAKEMVRDSGIVAFVGRTVSEEKGNKKIERHYSAPEAFNRFLYRLNTSNEVQ